jgi:hypothetical protein
VGIWCAPAVFCHYSVPCSHLVGVLDVKVDKRLCGHTQHDHCEWARVITIHLIFMNLLLRLSTYRPSLLLSCRCMKKSKM